MILLTIQEGDERVDLEEHVDKMSKEFGCSREDVIDNYKAFERMGFNEEDTLELAKVNTLFQNLQTNKVDKDIDLQRVIDIQFRLLDNVISLGRTAVKQVTHTKR